MWLECRKYFAFILSVYVLVLTAIPCVDVPKDNTYKLIVQGEFGSGIEAIINLKKSSEERNAKAQYDLGVMYYKGEGVEKDDKKAFKWFTKSAEQGNANAQYNLGSMHGLEMDYKKAVEWYTKSAEQGNANAQFNLGFMYSKGLGVEKDHEKAFEWYTKSAEQGNDFAKKTLQDISHNKND